MLEHNHYQVRSGEITDIPGVVALQSRYLFANMSEKEREQGFVTTPFTSELITRSIQEEQGLYVATLNDTVIGYAYGASWAYWAQWPMFQYMISRFDQINYNGQVPTVHNSYQYGPICVDLSVRGTGVAEALFEAVRLGFAARYSMGLTFINQVNALSMAFHTRKLGLVIVDEFSFNGNQYSTLAFSSPNQ